MKLFIAGFLTCYIFAGVVIGLGIKAGIPATNYYGVAYLACIWPAWILQPWTGWEPPVPHGVFSFEESAP